jgi:hypothetical protein
VVRGSQPEFRYQLTVVGQFGQAIVASEITNGTFIINTSKPGMKVSCQVTGIRQDAWANAHRIQVEVDNAPSPYFPAAYAGNKCISRCERRSKRIVSDGKENVSAA